MKKLIEKHRCELAYTIANYSTPIVTMISSGIAAAFIGPKELGKINSLQLIVTYLSFLHLGVFNGLNRNLAFYKAQNRTEKVQDLVNASHTVATIASFIGFCVGIILISHFLLNGSDWVYRFSSVLVFISITLNPMILHYDTTYRSGQHFSVLAKIIAIENVIFGFLSFLPVYMGYFGKIFSGAIRAICKFLLRYKSQPQRATGIGYLKDVIQLFKVGFPLLLGGYVWSVFIITDQTLIARKLGPYSVGLYSLSTIIIGSITIIPTSLSVVLYPKASALYGSTKNNIGLRKFFWQALIINCLIIIPLVIVVYFLLVPITSYILPKYVDGIEAAKINLLTCLTLISSGPSIILGVTKRNLPLIMAYLIGIVFIWIYSSMLPIESLTIENIAWARFAASLVISMIIISYSYLITFKAEFRE
ncbi:MAG: oligosaccharide flippase family protein [Candidatus Methanofastidiosa archaeon]|nr:oligosaccharide flippase family protein [Candidatus Methanofastidiosa archaeon]